jgi:hypothetical protein
MINTSVVFTGFLFRNILVWVICLLFSMPAVIAQQILPEYRIQVAALPRFKLDSLKTVCDRIGQSLKMNSYILDQDNYYKIVVGDFNSFSQANLTLQILRTDFHDAWITPAVHTDVIYTSGSKQPEEKPLDQEKIDELDVAADETEKISIPEVPLAELTPEEEPEIIIDDTLHLPEDEDLVIEISHISKKRRRFFTSIYAGGVYVDLHASNPDTRYCTYYGYVAGAGSSFAITKNLLLNLSADYSFANAFALFEKHNLTGSASVIKISPALVVGSSIYSRFGAYGRLGISYFNYDYAYNLELKPGYSGGPASVDAELLERAYNYGLDAGIGLRLFRNLDISVNSYYDLDERLYLSVKLGLVF